MQPADEIIYYDFDEFRIDVAEQRLSKNGKPMALTHKAFSVLLVLVQNAGRIVEKEKIIAAAWSGNAFVEEANLSQYVYVLRKTLGTDRGGNSYIETITKRGFRFTAPVKAISRLAASAAAGAAPESIDETPSPAVVAADSVVVPPPDEREIKSAETSGAASPAEGEIETQNTAAAGAAGLRGEDPLPPFAPPPPPPPATSAKAFAKVRRSASTPVRLLMMALLFSGLIIATSSVYQRRRVQPPNGGGAKIRSIAVLPFKTVEAGGGGGGGGGAPAPPGADEKPGLGMADAIITRLNKSKKFQVRSTSAVTNLTDQPVVNARHVGRELAVDAVLEGTVQRDGGGARQNGEGARMRVTAQLTNVADGTPLWQENYDEPASDIFTIQDTVSEKIAQSLEKTF